MKRNTLKIFKVLNRLKAKGSFSIEKMKIKQEQKDFILILYFFIEGVISETSQNSFKGQVQLTDFES